MGNATGYLTGSIRLGLRELDVRAGLYLLCASQQVVRCLWQSLEATQRQAIEIFRYHQKLTEKSSKILI